MSEAALLLQADGLRDARRWSEASQAYEVVLQVAPHRAEIWVQLGHARKEGGDLTGAVSAYERAIALRPDLADTHLQLGHALKLAGRLSEAITAYALAARLDRSTENAALELVELGASSRLPDPGDDIAQLYGVSRLVHELRMDLDRLERRLPALADFHGAPPEDLEGLRANFDLVGEPPPSPGAAFHVLLYAPQDDPASVRASLESLQASVGVRWRVSVLGSLKLAEDRIGAFVAGNSRLNLAFSEAWPASAEDEHLFCLRAGMVLEPRALAWFAAVFAKTGCAAVYCDYADCALAPTGQWTLFNPRLLEPFSLDALLQADDLVQALAFHRTHRPGFLTRPLLLWEDSLREGLLEAQETGVAHLPRLLASRWRPSADETCTISPVTELHARFDAFLDGSPGELNIRYRARYGDEPITAIIPTRDGAALLAACVTSLRAHAHRRDRLRLLIVDNGSVSTEMAAQLQGYRNSGVADVLRVDEPFNWSRLNNMAAAQVSSGLLLFMNDDTEMLSNGWDDLLRGYAQRAEVGVVGARLLYPNGTLQHAGIVLRPDGRPQHEGVAQPAAATGPNRRWIRTRPCAAVTGAFLAVRRSLFAELGGFDETQMPIAYSDIDFCLRVRALGRTVLYAPALTLLHHESLSRGRNIAPREVGWDELERAALLRRWGADILEDPYVNPYWAPGGRPLQMVHAPRQPEVWRAVDRSLAASRTSRLS